jgi:hypothetical protein
MFNTQDIDQMKRKIQLILFRFLFPIPLKNISDLNQVIREMVDKYFMRDSDLLYIKLEEEVQL